MGNIVKFSTPVSVNSIKSGGFNIGVNGTPADLTGFYTGICPINGGYTIYINKASNGPSIYTPNNDAQLINITRGLGGNVTTAVEALVWINSQSNMTVVNSNYPSIVTNGLVMDLDAGFVSSYPKGGTGWRDLSGNGNNGTLINGVSYNNENGGTLVFDGVNDSVNCGNQSSLNLTNFTLSIWFKTTITTNQVLIGKAHMTSYYMNTANGGLSLWTAGSSLGTTTGNLADGNWHYAVGTMNGTQKKIYADGVLLSSNTGTIPSIDTNDLFIGRSATVNIAFNGSVLDSQVYNRALSDAEILQNYQAGLQKFISTNGLVLSLDAQNTNLYATSATTAYDISGNGNNGSLINGVQYVGDADGSWRFDGVDDLINIPYSSYWDNNVFGNATNFTISCWAKCSSFYNWTCLVQKSPNSGFYSETEGAAIWVNASGFQGVFGSGEASNPPGYGNIWSYSTTNTNSWFHLLFTGDGTNGRFYVNGDLILSQPLSRTRPVVTSTNGPRLGIRGGGSRFFGMIGNVLLYTRSLNQTEISTIYNATKSRYGL